ncbi:MAG: histidinol dehydrogenase, partial [Planctomycetales bacterium]
MNSKLMIPTIDCHRDDAAARLAALRAKLSPRGDIVSEAGRRRTIEIFGAPLSPQQVVERICGDVARDGLRAVLDYTEKLDGKRLTPETIRVSPEEFDAAHRAADPAYLETIRRIRDNIAEFQRAVLPSDAKIVRQSGGGRVELRQRCRPLRRVGICVPGGAAAYPSTLLMTAVPAQVAGVKEIAVVVPPTEFGGFNADLLAACRELGVNEVYRVGGAQGVAALAYGIAGEATRTLEASGSLIARPLIERVDKIVGPGNLFVALAKRHVYGEVDIDSIAGPSEVVVLA